MGAMATRWGKKSESFAISLSIVLILAPLYLFMQAKRAGKRDGGVVTHTESGSLSAYD